MKSPKTIRILFAASAVLLLAVVLFAAMPHENYDYLIGTWRLYSVNGRLLDPDAEKTDETAVLQIEAGNRYTIGPFKGKWHVENGRIVLHTETYNGQTQQAFRADAAAKYPGDDSMQQVADKLFVDEKCDIGVNAASITITLGGLSQEYRRDAPAP